MPPPEVWGPATWTLFHVLAEKVNERIYPRIAGQIFDVIKRLCSALPCPECAQDATIFLNKVKLNELRSKNDFKNMIYMFHNYVNAKKRKPLYKYSDLEIYKKYNIVFVFNRFISVYHTKGNMRLLAESFQRQLIIRTVREWFSRNMCFFVPCQQPAPAVVEPVPVVEEPVPVVEKSVVEEPVVEEPVPVVEEPVVEEPVVEEPVVEEPVVEEPVFGISSDEIVANVEEPIISETKVEESVSDAIVSEEETTSSIVEETVSDATVSDATVSDAIVSEEETTSLIVESKEQTKSKRGRKKKTA